MPTAIHLQQMESTKDAPHFKSSKGVVMTSNYEKNVAIMAAFNRTDEAAVVAGREEGGSEIIRRRDPHIPTKTLEK